MVDAKSWIDQVRLKMNSAKTEFIYFGSGIQLSKCVVTHDNVNGELVERATLIKYLRAYLDAQLSFKEYTTKKCQTAIINYLHIRNICHLLTDSACETLLCIPLGLWKCTLVWTTSTNHRQIWENSEHVCTLSHKKIQKIQDHTVLQRSPLATNPSENWVQNIDSCILVP